MRLALPFLLLPLAAGAQDAMTAEEFKAFAEGRTLAFSTGGPAYGVEAYCPGRRVRWTVSGEEHEGVWYPKGPDICFRYEDRQSYPDERCWRFERTPGGLRGRLVSDPSDRRDYHARALAEPAECRGPVPIS